MHKSDTAHALVGITFYDRKRPARHARTAWHWCLTLAAAAIVTVPSATSAQIRFHIDGHASLPIDRPQSDEFGLGAGGGLALEWAPSSRLGLLARVQALALSSYSGALPQGLFRPDIGTLEALTLALRVRPLGWLFGPTSDGFWFEIAGGGGITGSVARPLVGGRMGIAFGTGSFAIGPFLGYTRVFETDNSPLPGDAHVASIGLEITHTFAVHHRVVALPRHAAPTAAPTAVTTHTCAEATRVTWGDFDHDECSDSDRDGDGVADVRDRCPDVGEDFDGFEDTDGCPDGDNDHDTIGDVFDACPNEPETVNGVSDDDGCPDQAAVQVVSGRIQVSEAIHFAFNSARILADSHDILQAVAQVLRTHPEYAICHIEGHADEIGEETYNYNMSYQRARSVVAELVRFGVERGRLVPMGFGRSSPIDPRRTGTARAANRRVEFVVNGHRSTGRARTEHGYINVNDEDTENPQ